MPVMKCQLLPNVMTDDDLASGKHYTQLRKPVPQQCVVDMLHLNKEIKGWWCSSKQNVIQ